MGAQDRAVTRCIARKGKQAHANLCTVALLVAASSALGMQMRQLAVVTCVLSQLRRPPSVLGACAGFYSKPFIGWDFEALLSSLAHP